jgi:glutamate racemase
MFLKHLSKSALLLFCFSFLLSFVSTAQKDIIQQILNDPADFYYVNAKNYPVGNRSLPVGVFDSGTGGLTVLNGIINYDAHHNGTRQNGADGVPDFQTEDFIYLADQANMPYGNYAGVGKLDLLREHIIKDAQFMLSNKYYGGNSDLKTDKKPVKVIVVACNTATAYGIEQIRDFLKKAGLNIPVVGVIDAGSEGALQTFKKNESGTIGIFATAGTVASNGYVNTLNRLRKELGYTGDIQYVSQGGVGVAEAVDEEPNYIDRKQTTPRANYKGPNVTGTDLAIDRALMDIYNFDFSENKMLCDAAKADDCSQLQINSADNYVRYHLVSLLEKMRATPNVKPLKTLILGCTHYPYLTENIHKVLKELYHYKKGRKYRYRHLLVKNVQLVDPSVNTAQELYEVMQQQDLFNGAGNMTNSEFYISVPNPAIEGTQTDAEGRFTYNYKYGRNAGSGLQFIKNMPFSPQNIPVDVEDRLRKQIPKVYALISHFEKQSPKTTNR